jgi:hypothetical protein
LYEIQIRLVNNARFVHGTFTLLGFLGQDVTLERLLVRDLSGAGNFKPFLGTGVGLNLWHFIIPFASDTLLAPPNSRRTFWALWAMEYGNG